MRSALVAACLCVASTALAQLAPQQWSADQDGANFICVDVGYFQANNLAGTGTRCAEVDPTGKIIPMSVDCGTVTEVTGANGVACSPSSPNPTCTLSTFACSAGDYVTGADATTGLTCATLANQQFQDATIGLLPPEPLIGTGYDASAGLCAVDDPGNTRTNVGLCSVGAVDSGSGDKLVTRVISDAYGRLGLASSLDLGTTSGVMEYVHGTPDTISVFAAGSSRIPFGSGTSGQLTDSADMTFGSDLVTVSFTQATGSHGIKLANSSNGTGAYSDFSLQNDLGNLSRADVYYTSSTYTGPDSAPSSLTFATAAGASSKVIFSPNNTQALVLSPSAVNLPLATASKIQKTDGSKNLVAATAGTDYQAPLTACTDYVSVSCQTGTTDIGGTNGTTTVIGIENTGRMRGDLLATNSVAPGTPAGGITALYADATSKNICAKDDAGNINHGIRDASCGASTWIHAVANTGVSTCTQPAFSDLSGTIACGQIPAAGTCTPTTTTGSSGAYVTGVTTDAKGWVTGVTTTHTPLAGSLNYTVASTSIAMGYNQSTLIYPLPAGAPISNSAGAGTAITTTMAANWGTSGSSPPTFAVGALGAISCTAAITYYVTTGTSAPITLVYAVYGVSGTPFTPGNWTLLASTTRSLSFSAGGNDYPGTNFSAFSTSGGLTSSQIVFVIYRSDAASATTLSTLNAQFMCSLGV